MRIPSFVPAFAAVAVLVAGGIASADSAAPAGDAAHGKQLYAANCAACHGAAFEGGVGPALTGEKTRKDAAAIRTQITDPAPPMPKLYPSVLSDKDVDDLTAFVLTL